MLAAYENSIFINCPYDPSFQTLFEAIVFTVASFGLTPRSAREWGGECDVRLPRILQLLSNCRYSVHDVSRLRGDGPDHVARMNMPLELGFAIAFRYERNGTRREHTWWCMCSGGYLYKQAISDLEGIDIEPHDETIDSVIASTAVFLRRHLKYDQRVSASSVRRAFDTFQLKLGKRAADALGKRIWKDIVETALETLPVKPGAKVIRVAPEEFLRENALRFLKSCPLPVAIKDATTSITDDATRMPIHWCNAAYSSLLGKQTTDVFTRTLRDLADVVDDRSDERKKWQIVRINGSPVYMQAPCCAFSVPARPWQGYLGDISFRNEDIRKACEQGDCPLDRPALDADDPGMKAETEIGNIAESFLKAFPTVVLIKDADHRVRWANSEFLKLVGARALDDVVNFTTSELLGKEFDLTVHDLEDRVIRGACILGRESLRGKDRYAVRFPIPDDRNEPAYVGVVSLEASDLSG